MNGEIDVKRNGRRYRIHWIILHIQKNFLEVPFVKTTQFNKKINVGKQKIVLFSYKKINNYF